MVEFVSLVVLGMDLSGSPNFHSEKNGVFNKLFYLSLPQPKNEAKNKKNISLFCPSNWEIPNLLQELNGYFTQKRQPFSWLTARGDWTEPNLLEDEKSSRPAGLSEGSL